MRRTRPTEPRASDWTKFNIGSSLQILRTGSPATTIQELPKLHLRWWHATAAQMTSTLRAAGLPQSILDACTHVVKTCRECRAWETPGKTTQQATTLSTYFNENVETDILFVDVYQVAHYVDRCIRWHAGGLIKSRSEADLYKALFCYWVGQHGPMKNLDSDGETALNTVTSKARL